MCNIFVDSIFPFCYIIGYFDDIYNDQNAIASNKTKVNDFSVSITRTKEDACIDCGTKFKWNELKIMHLVSKDVNQNDETATGHANWYHVACFVLKRSEIGWLQCGDRLPGFKRLLAVNRDIIRTEIP